MSLHDRERLDIRKVCQTCGSDNPVEYQVVHKDPRGFFHSDEKLDLCPECGQKFVDGVGDAAVDIVRSSNGRE